MHRELTWASATSPRILQVCFYIPETIIFKNLFLPWLALALAGAGPTYYLGHAYAGQAHEPCQARGPEC